MSPSTSEGQVDMGSHMIVVGALAWCIGYLEAIGHDVSDRPFIQAAIRPRVLIPPEIFDERR